MVLSLNFKTLIGGTINFSSIQRYLTTLEAHYHVQKLISVYRGVTHTNDWLTTLLLAAGCGVTVN